MNENKMKRLFELARAEPAPAPPAGFDQDVLRRIRNDRPAVSAGSLDIRDQLNRLFPRVAMGCAVLIALCLASDLAIAALSPTDLVSGVAQISDQWLFTARGF